MYIFYFTDFEMKVPKKLVRGLCITFLLVICIMFLNQTLSNVPYNIQLLEDRESQFIVKQNVPISEEKNSPPIGLPIAHFTMDQWPSEPFDRAHKCSHLRRK